MNKYTLKHLKQLAHDEIALDITNISDFNLEQLEAHENGFKKIGISIGTYGMNGALLKGYTTGGLYVITARNSTLFRLV